MLQLENINKKGGKPKIPNRVGLYIFIRHPMNIKVLKSLPRLAFSQQKAPLRTIARLTLAILVLFVFNQSALAYDLEVDGIYYNYISGSNKLEVTYENKNGNSYSGSVTIPTYLRINNITYYVYRIGDFAFENSSNLRSITFASDSQVSSIGVGAFYGCNGLTSVTLPGKLKTMEESAFYFCKNLTSVNITSQLTSIESYAFNQCSSLTSINIPESLTTIEDGVFWGCI